MKYLYLVLIIGLLSCGGNEKSTPSGEKVTKAEFGEAWPFTVDEGYVDCVGYKEVILRVDDKDYSLNGQANGTKKYYPFILSVGMTQE